MVEKNWIYELDLLSNCEVDGPARRPLSRVQTNSVQFYRQKWAMKAQTKLWFPCP